MIALDAILSPPLAGLLMMGLGIIELVILGIIAVAVAAGIVFALSVSSRDSNPPQE